MAAIDGPLAGGTPPRNNVARGWRRFGRYARALSAPTLLWMLVLVGLRDPLREWVRGENSYDRAALQEWLEEAHSTRTTRGTLPEMVEDCLAELNAYAEARGGPNPEDPAEHARLVFKQLTVSGQLIVKRREIHDHLETLGVPPTKRYPGQLLLFPTIYRLQVTLHLDEAARAILAEAARADGHEPFDAPIIWDSGLPSDSSQYRELEYHLHPHATVYVRYQLHAYNKRQQIEQEHSDRFRRLIGLAGGGTVMGLVWVVVVERRERERERQRSLAQQQVDQAERRHAEAERQLLQQRVATQTAERRALELKSQLYASIGIMAGSYAHNIKNLLVRPNDLLRRCLEADGLSDDQELMLHEVQQTLGTVTERLQQILHTVRRDPSRAEETVLDLNAVVVELQQTWRDLAREKWKLDIVVVMGEEGEREQPPSDALPPGSAPLPPGLYSPVAEEHLWIAGDVSHLQQAVENLLFNARDATFEMRNHLRDEARRADGLDPTARRQAIIGAAAWRGRVVLRTYRREGEIVLEVRDNGIGMTEEVARRCTETHFSTKRDNAIYEGHSTGMGLGLSFVVAILEHHHARLEIDSAPLHGATFRVRFPPAPRQERAAASQRAAT
jgi:signal transduction histidine kinase